MHPRKLAAYMNNGRWLIDCPVCSTSLPAWESGVVCPVCHPGMLARAFQPLLNGTLRPIADIELVEQARNNARRANEEYVPSFPAEHTRIEKILRLRPAPRHMNWVPGETLDDLCRQNIEHGDPVPEDLLDPAESAKG